MNITFSHDDCRTYKNLEKRVILECDGEAIPLPSLQGIVVLNIGSFMGGTNFWGGGGGGGGDRQRAGHDSDKDLFLPPSFDDGILEVLHAKNDMTTVHSTPLIK